MHKNSQKTKSMEGRALWKTDLEAVLEQMVSAESEQAAFGVAKSISFDGRVSPQELHAEAQALRIELAALAVGAATTCTDLLIEYASVLTVDHALSDGSDSSSSSTSDSELEVIPEKVKREFVPTNDEPTELTRAVIYTTIQKQIRLLRPLKGKLPKGDAVCTYLDALFALERDDTATKHDLRPAIHVLEQHYKQWPDKFQKTYCYIRDLAMDL
jgi:hypothetical protein